MNGLDLLKHSLHRKVKMIQQIKRVFQRRVKAFLHLSITEAFLNEKLIVVEACLKAIRGNLILRIII